VAFVFAYAASPINFSSRSSIIPSTIAQPEDARVLCVIGLRNAKMQSACIHVIRGSAENAPPSEIGQHLGLRANAQ